MLSGLAAPQPFAVALALSATALSVPVLSDSGPQTVEAGPATTVAAYVETDSTANALLGDTDPGGLFSAGARAAADVAPERGASRDRSAVGEQSQLLLFSVPASSQNPAAEASTSEVSDADEADADRTTDGDSSDDSDESAEAPTTTAATLAPRERAEVTLPPTTAPPTTAAPTTAAPTTQAPTTQAPTTTAPPTTEAPATTAAAGEPTAAQWAALRACESGGNYSIVSSNGLYHGAYQFSRATWDSVARSAGQTHLVGIAPHTVSAAEQDLLALVLWRASGWQPWPHCGKKAAAAG